MRKRFYWQDISWYAISLIVPVKAYGSGGNVLTISADLAQVTGTCALVTFSLGSRSLIADLEVGADSVPGSRLNVEFDLSRAILVDPRRGLTLV